MLLVFSYLQFIERSCVSFFQEHSRCYSDCSFSYTENNRTLTFDLSDLSDVASLTIGPSFTSKGTKYLHLFNVSLCGHEVAPTPEDVISLFPKNN